MQSLNCTYSNVKRGKVLKVSEQAQCPAGGWRSSMHGEHRASRVTQEGFKVCQIVQCPLNRQI